MESLPGDIIYLIYKNVFSLNVLEQIKYMPGNFKYIGFQNMDLVDQLEKDYFIIDKIGADAWKFLGKYDNFVMEANRKDKMYKIIFNSVYINPYYCDFSFCMNIMCYIAKHGWENYIKNPWVFRTN